MSVVCLSLVSMLRLPKHTLFEKIVVSQCLRNSSSPPNTTVLSFSTPIKLKTKNFSKTYILSRSVSSFSPVKDSETCNNMSIYGFT